MTESYTTPTAEVKRLENGIFQEAWYVPQLVDVNLLEQHLTISTEQYAKEKCVLILIDGSTTKKMNKAVRDRFSSYFEENRPHAIAVLTPSSISRAIGTLFLAVKRPTFPMKLFSKESKAIEWLLSYKE